jgi:PilZ domain
MPEHNGDKRSRQRIAVRLPVSIKSGDGQVQQTAHTRDLSSAGVFLYTSSPLAEGAEFEMVLVLPSELTFGERKWVCCQARVLRVDSPGSEGNFGIAARISRFEILPEI